MLPVGLLRARTRSIASEEKSSVIDHCCSEKDVHASPERTSHYS